VGNHAQFEGLQLRSARVKTGVKGVNKFRDKTEILFTTGKWFPPRGMLIINENIAKADCQGTAADDRRYFSRPVSLR
jgi:hypothetical protein